jgi:L-2,4-diaminobutyrate decarboxylase
MALFAEEFLTAAPESHAALREAVELALGALREAWPAGGYAGKSPAALARLFEAEPLPAQAVAMEKVFAAAKDVIGNSVMVSNPNVAAHFHPPPLIAAIAAEIVLSALNQSMDSFDQAPAATMLEMRIAQWLCEEAGLPATAAASFTSGGSQSNYMAMLLAREACVEKHFGWHGAKRGLPAEASRLRILCSEAAHFTIGKSAAQLGLGTDAVAQIPTDGASRMSVAALTTKLRELLGDGLIPMAIGLGACGWSLWRGAAFFAAVPGFAEGIGRSGFDERGFSQAAVAADQLCGTVAAGWREFPIY